MALTPNTSARKMPAPPAPTPAEAFAFLAACPLAACALRVHDSVLVYVNEPWTGLVRLQPGDQLFETGTFFTDWDDPALRAHILETMLTQGRVSGVRMGVTLHSGHHTTVQFDALVARWGGEPYAVIYLTDLQAGSHA